MANKKTAEKSIKEPRNYGSVVGILQVFVLVSIGFSTYIVFLGTQGLVPKVMLVPQALWAAILVVRKFVRS